MLKRYLLFRGYIYYAAGGWRDYQGSFDTVEEAIAHRPKTIIDEDGDEIDNGFLGAASWYQVVDSSTWKIVCEHRRART